MSLKLHRHCALTQRDIRVMLYNVSLYEGGSRNEQIIPVYYHQKERKKEREREKKEKKRKTNTW